MGEGSINGPVAFGIEGPTILQLLGEARRQRRNEEDHDGRIQTTPTSRL